MAWTTIKTWLPQDTLTASDLNTYLRDNQLETLAGPTQVGNGIAVVNGPNDALFRPIAHSWKTTSATTSSTSPVDVGPSTNLSGITHSGHIAIEFSAEIANSSSSFTNYAIGVVGTGSLATIARAVRNNSSTRMSLSAHVIHWGVPSPVSLTGFLWTDNAATTATLYNSRVRVYAL